MSWEKVFRRTDQPGSERHFQCECRIDSPPAPHASTRTILCRMRGWCRCWAGRADRLTADHRREGVDQDAADQVRRGEPGTEAADGDRRDVRGRGQHRRPGHVARGRDAHPVRRGLRALDVGHAVARVQLRARPPAGIGAARAPGRPGRTHRAAGRAGRAGVRRHRLAAAPGLRARQTGRLLRAHQDRRQAGAAQGALAAGHHDQHRALLRR